MFRQHAPLSPSTLRFGAATLFLIACAPVPEQPPPSGTGGSGSLGGNSNANGGFAFGGSTSFGGNTSSFGGSTGSSGASTTMGGATTSVGGTTTGTSGGATGTTGGTATTTGGTATATGGTATGTGGTTVASCDPLKVAATTPTVYDGASTGTCGNSAKEPYTGYWYVFNDATTGATQTPMKTGESYLGSAPGKGGGTDCGFHTTGTGFTKWGGGAGIDFHNFSSKSCPLDATAFSGIQFSVKGTTTGTQGDGYVMLANVIRVNLTTTTDFTGDDYGGWCPLTADWSLCKIDFATAKRIGYATTVTGAFDKTKLVKIQFQSSKYEMATSVTFDFWIDDLAFY